MCPWGPSCDRTRSRHRLLWPRPIRFGKSPEILNRALLERREGGSVSFLAGPGQRRAMGFARQSSSSRASGWLLVPAPSRRPSLNAPRLGQRPNTVGWNPRRFFGPWGRLFFLRQTLLPCCGRRGGSGLPWRRPRTSRRRAPATGALCRPRRGLYPPSVPLENLGRDVPAARAPALLWAASLVGTMAPRRPASPWGGGCRRVAGVSSLL